MGGGLLPSPGPSLGGRGEEGIEGEGDEKEGGERGCLTGARAAVQWGVGMGEKGTCGMAWRYVIGIVVGGGIGFAVGFSLRSARGG